MGFSVDRKTGTEKEQKAVIDKVNFVEQKSEEWLKLRKNLITASSAHQIIPKTEKIVELYNNILSNLKDKEKVDIESTSGYFNSEYNYYRNKMGLNPFVGNSATFFGEKYEDISVKYYKDKTQLDVSDYGILLHSEYPWLGGSPDGIDENGEMLEIKTLYTRQMIDDYIPLKYYIQVQICLEVADLEHCNYIETSLEEYTNFNSFWTKLNETDFYGAVIENNSSKKYVYNCDIQGYRDFVDDNSGYLTFFKILKTNIKSIKRDREFFNEIFPYLKKGIETLEQLKNGEKNLVDLQGYTEYI